MHITISRDPLRWVPKPKAEKEPEEEKNGRRGLSLLPEG